MDIARLEDAIDRISGTLMSVHSRPSACCRRVKAAILERAFGKELHPRLEFGFKDIQEIGKELIHESPYSYLTYLNRKTLNDVLHRLMKDQLVNSPYFNVPRQKKREVLTQFNDISSEELLLIEAIDRELKSFVVKLPDSSEAAQNSAEDDLVCRIIASSAIHGAMVFKGFHQELISTRLKKVDLTRGFLVVPCQRDDSTEDGNKAFFRFFISPITLVYLLHYVSIYRRKDIVSKSKKHVAEGALFRDKWIGRSGDIETLFRRWTEKLACKFSLHCTMTIERFRKITIQYLSMRYPIFLLSVHSRSLLSDSLAAYYFACLLNIEADAPPNVKFKMQGGKGPNAVLREKMGGDRALTRTVFRITTLRGSIRDKSDRKMVSAQIRDEVEAVMKSAVRDGGKPSPLLSNYKIYWDWLLHVIGRTDIAPRSIDTYTGSIGRHFIPLLSEQSVLTSGREYIEKRILVCMNTFATNSFLRQLKLFFSFVKLEYPEIDLPNLSQKRFRKSDGSSPKPFIHFMDVKKVISAISDVQIRLITLLGFYAGLRAGEIVNLKLSNIIYDGGYVLCVRKSKTRNGGRNIPLYLLMPEEYLREFIAHWRSEVTKRGGDDFLFVRNGRRFDSRFTSPLIEDYFMRGAGVVMEFHNLRHSFANWFLIRWFAAIHGKDFFDPDCEFLQDEVFNVDHLERIRCLLFGFRVLKIGQDSFSHVLAALARLIGHGSPRMTIRYYIHVLDFLMHLYLQRKHGSMQVSLTKKALRSLLNVSPATLPKYLNNKSADEITIQEIVNAQRDRLGLTGRS